MKKPYRLTTYLAHISQAANNIVSYTQALDREGFLASSLHQNAVMMSFIVIGEATAHIMARYADFAARHPEIPWRKMRGMRNHVAHGYFEVDQESVWDTVQEHIPELLASMSGLQREAEVAEDMGQST